MSHNPKAAASIKARAATPLIGDDWQQRCKAIVPPPGLFCGRPTVAADGKGINKRYCTKHAKQFRRHGSADRKSYSAGELAPYLWAARKWIKRNLARPDVQATLAGIGGRNYVIGGGRPKEGLTMLRAKPEARAENVIRRLSAGGIPSKRVLEIALAIRAIASDDASQSSTEHFLTVQLGKRLNSIAPTIRPSTVRGERKLKGPHVDEYLRRARDVEDSEGPFLAVLGQMIEKQSARLAERAVADVIGIKVARFGEHPSRAAITNSVMNITSLPETESDSEGDRLSGNSEASARIYPRGCLSGGLIGSLEALLTAQPSAVDDDGISSPSLDLEPAIEPSPTPSLKPSLKPSLEHQPKAAGDEGCSSPPPHPEAQHQAPHQAQHSAPHEAPPAPDSMKPRHDVMALREH